MCPIACTTLPTAQPLPEPEGLLRSGRCSRLLPGHWAGTARPELQLPLLRSCWCVTLCRLLLAGDELLNLIDAHFDRRRGWDGCAGGQLGRAAGHLAVLLPVPGQQLLLGLDLQRAGQGALGVYGHMPACQHASMWHLHVGIGWGWGRGVGLGVDLGVLWELSTST
jgi:hypothetical protein